MIRILGFIIALAVFAAVLWNAPIKRKPVWSPDQVWHASRAPRSTDRRVTLAVKGMVCKGCALAVKLMLEKVDGVIDAKVDLASGTAVVIIDPHKATPQDLLRGIRGKKAIYNASIVKVVPPLRDS